MSKKQRFGEEGSLGAGVGSPPTTIVGGQRRRGLHQQVRIPVGIERALYLAATDAGFRARLLERRAGAAREAGLPLTGTEASVLDNQDAASLGAAIDRLRPADRDRRQLLQVVAASFVSVAAGTATGGCVSCDVESYPNHDGHVPDLPDALHSDSWVPHDVVPPMDAGGHLADVPDIPDALPPSDAEPTGDASVPDASRPDASRPDASLLDASRPDAAITPPDGGTGRGH